MRVEPRIEVRKSGGGFEVRGPVPPLSAGVWAPTRALAEAVAAEWHQSASADAKHQSKPKRLTHLAIQASGIRADFKASVAAVAAYGANDLLCYRGPQGSALAERQQEIWPPLLDWLAQRHGVTLAVTHGIAAIDQDQVQLGRLSDVVAEFDAYHLAALADATSVCGSVIVALALAAGIISEAEAWEASTLDETFQAETWGQDEEAVVSLAAKRQDLAAAHRFLRLVQSRD